MTSGKKQRAKIEARRAKRAAARPLRGGEDNRELPWGAARCDPTRLAPSNSYSIPDFVSRGYYLDFLFRCKDCGVEETWSGAQQKWWYEDAKGDAATIANRCRPCRQKERARRTAARDEAKAGMAKKLASKA